MTGGPDDLEPTQRFERVEPPPVAPPPVAPPPVARSNVRAPYVPAFGNLATYSLARVAALVVDFGVGTFVFACFGFEAVDRGVLTFAPKTIGGYTAIAGFALLAALTFAVLCEALASATLGKALFALGVRRNDGGHPGLGRTIVRYAVLPIDVLGVGFLLALVLPRHRRLGDLLAGTIVARNRIGAFATLVSVVLLGGVGYLLFAIGGGFASVFAVTAESAFFLPTIANGAAHAVGFGGPESAPPTAGATSTPSPFPSPSPLPSDAVSG